MFLLSKIDIINIITLKILDEFTVCYSLHDLTVSSRCIRRHCPKGDIVPKEFTPRRDRPPSDSTNSPSLSSQTKLYIMISLSRKKKIHSIKFLFIIHLLSCPTIIYILFDTSTISFLTLIPL